MAVVDGRGRSQLVARWLPGGSPFQDSRDATSLQSQGQSRREGQRVQEGQEGAKDGAATAKKR